MATIDSNYNITARQGATMDFLFVHSVIDPDTGTRISAVDLTNYEFRFRMKKAAVLFQVATGLPLADDPDAAAQYGVPVKTSSIEIVAAAEGQFALYVSAARTAAMAAGDWQYEIDMIEADQDVRTFLSGTITIEKEVK